MLKNLQKKSKNSKTTELSWRRAVPVNEIKSKSKMETQLDEKDEDKEVCTFHCSNKFLRVVYYNF